MLVAVTTIHRQAPRSSGRGPARRSEVRSVDRPTADRAVVIRKTAAWLRTGWQAAGIRWTVLAAAVSRNPTTNQGTSPDTRKRGGFGAGAEAVAARARR